MVAFETASTSLRQNFRRLKKVIQNWIHKNLRQIGSPANNVASVASSLMSELCVNFEKPGYNPDFNLQTILASGTDRREKEI